MVTTLALPLDENRDERKGRLVAWISTIVFATAVLLILLLIKIITPIPAIPPDPEVISIEIGLVDGSGGDAETRGGGSNGNTGNPGMQSPTDAANSVTKPANSGTVTDNDPDNPSANSANSEPKMDADMLAAIANYNKNKGKASITVGGDGKGDPYTGGLGNGSGVDVGPGKGDPGTGTPGGHNGDSQTGSGRVRHIKYKPEIVNPTQEEGKVVVNVYVNRQGVVTKTEVNRDGTTTLNSLLRSTATQSAFKIQFDADPTGPELLLLPIEIYFTLK